MVDGERKRRRSKWRTPRSMWDAAVGKSDIAEYCNNKTYMYSVRTTTYYIHAHCRDPEDKIINP